MGTNQGIAMIIIRLHGFSSAHTDIAYEQMRQLLAREHFGLLTSIEAIGKDGSVLDIARKNRPYIEVLFSNSGERHHLGAIVAILSKVTVFTSESLTAIAVITAPINFEVEL